MSEFSTLIRQIRGTRSMTEFADELGLTAAAVSRYESGKRQREPEKGFVAALLRVAEPEQQRDLLLALGMDVAQFEAAILESAGVVVVTAAMGFERQYLDDGDWESVDRATVKRELGFWYIDGGDRVMEVLETSARTNAPKPGKSQFTPQATYRATATVTATVGGNGSGDGTEEEETGNA